MSELRGAASGGRQPAKGASSAGDADLDPNAIYALGSSGGESARFRRVRGLARRMHCQAHFRRRTMSTFRNPLTEYSPEMEFEQNVGEYEAEGGVFSEADEVELTSELLNVTNEQELEAFFGDLINKAGSLFSGAAGAVNIEK